MSAMRTCNGAAASMNDVETWCRGSVRRRSVIGMRA